jgi:hypothetical protein
MYFYVENIIRNAIAEGSIPFTGTIPTCLIVIYSGFALNP